MIRYHPFNQALIGVPGRAQFVVACASMPVMSLLALNHQGILTFDNTCLALQVNLGVLTVMPFVHAMFRNKWKAQYEERLLDVTLKLLNPDLNEKTRRRLEGYRENLKLQYHLALDWIPTYKAIDKIKWSLSLAVSGLRGSHPTVLAKQ
ncbi:hypothetical protein [Pseudomonas sp. NPDC086278]|uniref:hypothetical protein n=1 Tax=Pseudomonas sp. NPDC086278 TaxID=3390646 RepID=UPI003D02E623